MNDQKQKQEQAAHLNQFGFYDEPNTAGITNWGVLPQTISDQSNEEYIPRKTDSSGKKEVQRYVYDGAVIDSFVPEELPKEPPARPKVHPRREELLKQRIETANNLDEVMQFVEDVEEDEDSRP